MAVMTRAAPLTLALILAACASVETAATADSPDTSQAAISTHVPAPVPSSLPTASPGPSPSATLHPDGIAEVVTGDLVVRSLPEISDHSSIHPTYLQRGQLLFVLQGPVAADGFDWYEVVPFERCPTCSDVPPSDVPDIGWVAAGAADGEEHWIAPFSEACSDPQSDAIWWRPGFIALACLGAREVTVEGTLGGCAGLVSGFLAPAWLAEGGCELIPAGFDPLQGGGIGPAGLWFAIDPDVSGSLPAHDEPIRITGRMDHPEAETCAEAAGLNDPPTPPEVVVLRCRVRLVATRIETLTESDGP